MKLSIKRNTANPFDLPKALRVTRLSPGTAREWNRKIDVHIDR